MGLSKQSLVDLFNTTGDVNVKLANMLAQLDWVSGSDTQAALAECVRDLCVSAIRAGYTSGLNEAKLSSDICSALNQYTSMNVLVFDRYRPGTPDWVRQRASLYLETWNNLGVDLPDDIVMAPNHDDAFVMNWNANYKLDRRSANIRIMLLPGRFELKRYDMAPMAATSEFKSENYNYLTDRDWMVKQGLAPASWIASKFNPMRSIG